MSNEIVLYLDTLLKFESLNKDYGQLLIYIGCILQGIAHTLTYNNKNQDIIGGQLNDILNYCFNTLLKYFECLNGNDKKIISQCLNSPYIDCTNDNLLQRIKTPRETKHKPQHKPNAKQENSSSNVKFTMILLIIWFSSVMFFLLFVFIVLCLCCLFLQCFS